MSEKPYTVLAVFEAKQGKEAQLYEILNFLVAPTLQEKSCINYDLHRSENDPAAFIHCLLFLVSMPQTLTF